MINTAVVGAPGFAINNNAGSIIKQPKVMVNLRVLSVFQPCFHSVLCKQDHQTKRQT